MLNFWQDLPKPIFALAPMEGVTDCAFRDIFAKYGVDPTSRIKDKGLGINPFVMFTEFVNVDGLLHPEGFERLKVDLEYTESQRPIVAQIWGRDPEKFYKASQLLLSLGFDGIDINFGCPQDKEIRQKTCAALILEPKRAGEIIKATIQGSKDLPVSVKTRVGYSKVDEMGEWVSHLLKYPIAALTIHARTKKEKSKVPAHWEKIKEAVNIRDKLVENREKNRKTLIIGNGDIKSRQEGLDRIKETGCDGVMVARGAFGNPWLFRSDFYQPSVEERLRVILEHAELFEYYFKNKKNFVLMRKNFKAYASGFNGANELRVRLMETLEANDVEQMVKEFLRQNTL